MLTLSISQNSYSIYQIETIKLTTIEEILKVHTFFSITRTQDELSVVCLENTFSDFLHCEDGWRSIRIINTFPLSSVGVLVSVLWPLANAKINIFAISTFDTDYILVKDEMLGLAKQALTEFGHIFL